MVAGDAVVDAVDANDVDVGLTTASAALVASSSS